MQKAETTLSWRLLKAGVWTLVALFCWPLLVAEAAGWRAPDVPTQKHQVPLSGLRPGMHCAALMLCLYGGTLAYFLYH